MSLLDRMSGINLDEGNDSKIPVHQFYSALVQYFLGRLSEATIKTQFGIVDGTDLSEWNWLKGKFDASLDKERFLLRLNCLFLLAERRLFGYDAKATIQTEINAIP